MPAKKPQPELVAIDAPHKTKLRDQIVVMLGIERQIHASLEPISQALRGHRESLALLARVGAMAEDHMEALRIRLMVIEVRESDLFAAPLLTFVSERQAGVPSNISTALQTLYALLSQATFGYSILRSGGLGAEPGGFGMPMCVPILFPRDLPVLDPWHRDRGRRAQTGLDRRDRYAPDRSAGRLPPQG